MVETPAAVKVEDLTEEEVFDKFLDKIKHEYKDGWTEENWEEEMEKHPFFMTKLPDGDNAAEMPAAVEALRQLKWDPDEGPKDIALKLKEEGNLLFKAKKYKNAIVSYSKALEEKFDDDRELLSVLHSNRATCHFLIENYRSALNDSVFAYKFNPHNAKAVSRGAQCCFALKRFDDCVKWCDKGLLKEAERNKRKQEAQSRKVSSRQEMILNLVKKQGVQVQESDKQFLNLLLSPMNPNQVSVQMTDDLQHLKWPVIFLYPEYGQTDFIESFDENSTLNDHLSVMFEQLPAWDARKEYIIENIQIYYENAKLRKMVRLKKSLKLIEVLQQEGLIVQLATPSFVVMVKNSDFQKIYLSKYAEFNG